MADKSDSVSPEEIEELLRQAQAAAQGDNSAAAPPLAAGNASAPPPASATKTAAAPPTSSTKTERPQVASSSQTADDAQFLLAQAEAALASVDHPIDPAIRNISPFQFPELAGSPASTERATLDLLSDVELDLRIELGRAQMHLEEVLKLRRGAVVTLDKLAGDPVDIYVNGRLVARGEVLVLNDNFCVRVAELLSGSEAA